MIRLILSIVLLLNLLSSSLVLSSSSNPALETLQTLKQSKAFCNYKNPSTKKTFFLDAIWANMTVVRNALRDRQGGDLWIEIFDEKAKNRQKHMQQQQQGGGKKENPNPQSCSATIDDENDEEAVARQQRALLLGSNSAYQNWGADFVWTWDIARARHLEVLPCQLINHFLNSDQLAKKGTLLKNLRQTCEFE